MPKVSVVSIIIPVFNREEFVGEAIESVLQQDCGTEHVEIVLVDDGSEDASPEICHKYQAEHPETIVVIHKPNGGVSSAFNAGVERASGDVIGFLGSDDTLSNDAVSNVIEFFDSHWDEVDLVAIKIEMFGSRSGPHWNNKKRFASTGVINVAESWNQPQMSGGGTFIKKQMFTEVGLRFDTSLFITEDATLNTQVILHKMAYGTLSTPTYHNRRYIEGAQSQVASSHFKREFFDVVLDRAYGQLIRDARARFGAVPLYVQAVICYDLAFRFRGNFSMLDEAALERYRERIGDLLREVSVLAIMSSRAPIEQRLNMLDLRKRGELATRIRLFDGLATLEGVRIYSFNPEKFARHQAPRVDIYSLKIEGDEVELVGALYAIELNDGYKFGFRVGRKFFPVKLDRPFVAQKPTLHDKYSAGRSFKIVLNVKPAQSFKMVVRQTGRKGRIHEYPIAPRMGRATGVAGSSRVAYYRRNARDVLNQTDRYTLRRRLLSSTLEVIKSEAGFLRRMKQAKLPYRTISLRLRAQFARLLKPRKQLWLMADHKRDAGDNAEALFRYICEHPELDIHPVMALSAEAPEHAALSRLGEIVEPGSRKFYRRYFQADVFLNSAADEYMLNPLAGDRLYVQDMIPPFSVFLQHGVTKDDQSAWLNWPRKGFDLVVASARREWLSFVQGQYGYEENQVALVGMPRMDRLEDRREKLIVLAPTWRKNLVGVLDEAAGHNAPGMAFAVSQYRANWQSIISSPRFNAALSRFGYRAVFAIHPSHAQEVSSFTGTEYVQVSSPPHDYRELFARGSVLTTDYSSVAFDFAYLRKPVVYFQPDRQEFYSGHLYGEGYFSYDDDGFGAVTVDVEGLIDELIAIMARDGKMDSTHRDRVESFFEFEGGGNAARLCAAILNAQANRERDSE